MLTRCNKIDLRKHGRRKVRAHFDGGRMCSDGGTLLLRAADWRSGLSRRLAT